MITLNPECQQGKHHNCDLQCWAEDRLCRCPCACHPPVMVRSVRQGGYLPEIDWWLAANNLPSSKVIKENGVIVNAQLISVTSVQIDAQGGLVRDVSDDPIMITTGHPLLVPLPVALIFPRAGVMTSDRS